MCTKADKNVLLSASSFSLSLLSTLKLYTYSHFSMCHLAAHDHLLDRIPHDRISPSSSILTAYLFVVSSQINLHLHPYTHLSVSKVFARKQRYKDNHEMIFDITVYIKLCICFPLFAKKFDRVEYIRIH